MGIDSDVVVVCFLPFERQFDKGVVIGHVLGGVMLESHTKASYFLRESQTHTVQ
jgi:hypothetical protein